MQDAPVNRGSIAARADAHAASPTSAPSLAGVRTAGSRRPTQPPQ